MEEINDDSSIENPENISDKIADEKPVNISVEMKKT